MWKFQKALPEARPGEKWLPLEGFSSWKAEFHSPPQLAVARTEDAPADPGNAKSSVNRSDKNPESGNGEMSQDCRLTSNFRSRN